MKRPSANSVLGICLLPCVAGATEPSAEGLLAIAKQAGACGILSSQSSFQASTQLEGGDAFIQRFWTMEAARLGKTPEQYVSDCQQAIEAYDMLVKAATVAQPE